MSAERREYVRSNVPQIVKFLGDRAVVSGQVTIVLQDVIRC
jgi:hypothetical protein